MSPRISIIGAGSAYMASVFWGIIKLADTFKDAEFVLMDVDEEHLLLMYELGKTMFQVAGCSVKLKATTNLLESLKGADFVLTTFRPGGFEARHLDETIPPIYGVIGNETVGPGGLFMACRSIPIMLDIVHKIEQVCPKAVILNYTNPTNIVTTAVTRNSEVKIIGLCDQHLGERYALAKLLNINEDKLLSNNVGINHATWMTALYKDGENILPKLRDILTKLPPDIDDNIRKSLELYSIFGAYPTYYLRYYYYTSEIFESQQKKGVTRAQEIMNNLPSIWASYRSAINHHLPRPLLQRGGSDHGEFALDIIASLLNENPRIRVINILNGNALPDFPQNCIVECPVVLSKQGVFPIAQDALPSSISGMLKSIQCYEELAVEAAVQGDRKLLLQALLAHPLVRTINKAEQLMQNLLDVHKPYLPQFWN
jgi:6-phospho-beta-glucosidase